MGILHLFHRKRLLELNAIPKPTTPLEQFLGHFFLDLQEDNDESNVTSGSTNIQVALGEQNMPDIQSTSRDPNRTGTTLAPNGFENNQDGNTTHSDFIELTSSYGTDSLTPRCDHGANGRHPSLNFTSSPSPGGIHSNSREVDEVIIIRELEEGIRTS